jgi:peptidoglycan/LPS O-acetylase OafA/YrhL
MIEISRYILATIVAETHLWSLGPAWTGHIAVFAFYTLSGYLMTRVLHERYGFSVRGIVAFLLNRVLRISRFSA